MSSPFDTHKKHPQALKQNLDTLDKISKKMVEELKTKNNMAETSLNGSKRLEPRK